MFGIALVICNTILAIFLFGGAGYVVFVLNESPWWFLAAAAIYAGTFLSGTMSET